MRSPSSRGGSARTGTALRAVSRVIPRDAVAAKRIAREDILVRWSRLRRQSLRRRGPALPEATSCDAITVLAARVHAATATVTTMLHLLDAFAQAWNRHDLEALMGMMTEDCVFEASAGDAVDGARFVGPTAVRAAFAAVFEQFPDAQWRNARHFVVGDRGWSEWTFTGTMRDGRRVEVNGCDLFTFRDGRIAIKNSFRKNRPPFLP